MDFASLRRKGGVAMFKEKLLILAMFLLCNVTVIFAEDSIEDIDSMFLENGKETAVVSTLGKGEALNVNVLDKINYLLIVLFLGATGAVLIAGGEVYREIYDDYLEHKKIDVESEVISLETKLKVLQYKLSFLESGEKYMPDEAFFESLETLERLSKEKQELNSLLKMYGGRKNED